MALKKEYPTASMALLIITKVGAPPPVTVNYVQRYRSSRIMMTDDHDQVSTDSATRAFKGAAPPRRIMRKYLHAAGKW